LSVPLVASDLLLPWIGERFGLVFLGAPFVFATDIQRRISPGVVSMD
jgi:hypothetical protein